jgi:hypothetical protein
LQVMNMRLAALLPPFRSPRLQLCALAIGALVVGGCVGSPSTPGASSPPKASPSGSASPSAGFYLRAWRTQALAPEQTFGWLASVTISNGQFIDGNVAIPMIYPGPIYVSLQSRPISQAGITAVIAEARKDGLLAGGATGGGAQIPGGMTAHIELVVDGIAYDRYGPMPGGTAATAVEPAAAGFDDFWNKVSGLGQWLAADLGPGAQYAPGRLAVLLAPPTAVASDGPLKATDATWPLSSTFTEFGTPLGTQYRCGVVTGGDLARLLPAVQSANQLTLFADSAGSKVSLQARALVPGEPSPCG